MESDNLKINEITVSSEEKITKTNQSIDKNVYKNFHDKYSKLTKEQPIQDDLESFKFNNNESKEIIKNIIKELDEYISKIDKENNINEFLRFLSMKSFLCHLLTKFLDNTEILLLLEEMYSEIKSYITNPVITYSAFLLINSIATEELKKDTSLMKAKEVLEECQSVYKTLKLINKEDIYYTSLELFSPDYELPINNEVKIKYEKLVVTNLLLLGSIYEKIGDHHKDIVCYHTAFKRMLDKGLVSPYKWVDFITRLACVFIDDNNFK